MKQRFIIVLSLLLCCTFSWADDPVTEAIPEQEIGKWRTYSPSSAVEIPAVSMEFPIKVYVATYSEAPTPHVSTILINGENPISIVEKSGLLLKATDDYDPEVTYSLSIIETPDPSIVKNLEQEYGNRLKGTGNTTPSVNSLKLDFGSETYIMILHKTLQTFVNYGSTGTEIIPANKAYLPITPLAPETPSIRIVEESETVTNLDNCAENAERSVKLFRNGQLYIVRDGITYDLMGRTIR